MAILTDEDLALLAEPQLAHVATVEADGSPHVTPVWVDTDGEHILFNTAKGRVKYQNIRRNPEVAVSVADKANDFRTLWVKGTAELVEEGADEHIDRMAQKYLGQDRYPFRRAGEERVIVRITPTQKLGRG
ncbi:PPOX class probable F420-dependent enzyme/PPOX class probable F420-dependent enzyme, Rv2061 family [Micromonospora echinaurantiaca]|uniref:PPOX class probable F420-dependent enzyme/PPOX class probable F420-dependent enzyme, Rv2061 family n=1 Tax=Micromonospora echinaurantiaca TaxID=47857 RepID=A0A1C5KBW0_9ACTN|nr:PPOX class F420-dependent oxidoreductase [Micromonospora echinaurantiaca]SCG80272.1 PPOX class probable F420-dependent enzyme/PPOX class probable F420-dependent enzyme, Rv2061 family [Micromonospora echinaurantiaca]